MASQFGVPIYPGASIDNSRYAVTETTSTNNSKMYLLLVTGDAPETVSEYYRQSLAAESVTMGGATVLRGRSARGALVTINVARDPRGDRTVFAITALFDSPAAIAQSTQPVVEKTPFVIVPSTPGPSRRHEPLVDVPLDAMPAPRQNPQPAPMQPEPEPAPPPVEPPAEEPYENPIPEGDEGLPPGEGPPGDS